MVNLGKKNQLTNSTSHSSKLRTHSDSNETYIKRSLLKNNFKNASLILENCGESMPIFVNVGIYVFKLCAVISDDFRNIPEMAAHDLDTYIFIFTKIAMLSPHFSGL